MKQSISLFLLFFALIASAQEPELQFSYYSDSPYPINMDVNETRNTTINGKIITSYEGEWPNDAKGAFEYACKLIEEVIPFSLPINITAVWDNSIDTFDNGTNLSSFQPYTFGINEYSRYEESYDPLYRLPYPPSTLLKVIMGLECYELGHNNHYISAMSTSLLESDDIRLTYYNHGNRLLNNCSFSLNSDCPIDKYDFVTVVMRDIFKAFGTYFRCTISGDRFYVDHDKLNFLESQVLDYLSGNNLSSVCSGTFPIGNLSLYAPSSWSDTMSLQYFVPQDDCKLTHLLSTNIGRGSVVRDLIDCNKDSFFASVFGWENQIAVGINTLNDTLPHYRMCKSISTRVVTDDDFDSMMNAFLPFYCDDEGINKGCYMLMKDGTYDKLNSICDTVATNLFAAMNFPLESYARTSDGKLCCLVYSGVYNTHKPRVINKHYAAAPQKIELNYRNTPVIPGQPTIPNIIVGMKNLEGAERVEVSTQINNGRVNTYDLTDFRKGYFTLLNSVFNDVHVYVTAYNAQGSTVSDVLTIEHLIERPGTPYPPIIVGPKTLQVNNEGDDDLHINEYKVTAVSENYKDVTAKTDLVDDVINLSNLSSGTYSVRVKLNNNETYDRQFIKE